MKTKTTGTKQLSGGGAARSAPTPPALAAALAVMLALAVAILVPTGTVYAHARYDRSEPGDNEAVAESPAEVHVWFTQELRRAEGLPEILVVNDSGDVIADEAILDDDDRMHAWIELPPALPEGRYTVIWHNLSDADGDEARGAFHFFVGDEPDPDQTPDPGDQPVTPEPEPGETPGATPTPIDDNGDTDPGDDPGEVVGLPDDDDDNGVAIWVLIVGVLAGAAIGLGAGFLFGRGFGA